VATLCFDLDGTLCTNTSGDYDRALPFLWAIARVNRLAVEGHRIVIFTARGTATGIDWSEVTRAQLKAWGVRYDSLHFGKPSAAVYVDDRAVHTEAWRRGSGFGAPGLPPAAIEGEVLPTVLAPSASAVVELSRTFGGRPLRLEDRVSRLLLRAERSGIGQLPSPAEVAPRVSESLQEHVDEDVLYSICLTDAAQFSDLEALASGGSPRLSVSCRPLTEVQVALSALSAPGSERSGPPPVRVALSPADSGPAPSAWPLHVDTDGQLTAGLGARLGLVDVEGGTLVLEPRRGEPDVAALWLSELADREGLRTEEGPLTAVALDAAAAVFLIGEPYCLLAAGPPEGSERAPGLEVLARLWDAWEQDAGVGLSLGAPDGALTASARSSGRLE
jgi:hypothetical protein